MVQNNYSMHRETVRCRCAPLLKQLEQTKPWNCYYASHNAYSSLRVSSLSYLSFHLLMKPSKLTCRERCCNGLRGKIPLYRDETDGVLSGRQQPLDQWPRLGAVQRHLRGVGPICGAVAQDEEVGGRCRGAPRHRHGVGSHLWQVEVGNGPDSWRNGGFRGHRRVFKDG